MYYHINAESNPGWVCIPSFNLTGSSYVAAYLLSLGGVLWELVLSQTSQFCCLWNVCNSSYVHIYFLNIPLCPLLFILTQQELPWFVRLIVWSLLLMVISHVYKLSQTTFMSQNQGWKTAKCSSAELLVIVLPAKDTNCDEEIRKHKADQEEWGPVLVGVNIFGVVY